MPEPIPEPKSHQPSDTEVVEAPLPSKRIQKPSAHVRDILEGCGTMLAQLSDPKVPCGVQVPSKIIEETPAIEGENDAKMIMVID
ncbi:hypothetical protein H0H87_005161, partial [Tephrocybe sp. NHM501043]